MTLQVYPLRMIVPINMFSLEAKAAFRLHLVRRYSRAAAPHAYRYLRPLGESKPVASSSSNPSLLLLDTVQITPAPPPSFYSSACRRYSTSRPTPASSNIKESKMLLQCQCASISIPIPNPADPKKEIPLYICHCTQCQRQSSSLFGTTAIFPASIIFPLCGNLKARLSVWTRPTKEGRSMDCYFCKTCGSRLMHRIREPDGRERETVSLKAGCLVDSESATRGNGEDKSPALDFSRATHLYTAHAVVDLENWPWPHGAKRWEGSPEVMEGRPGSASASGDGAVVGSRVGDKRREWGEKRGWP